MGKWGEDVTLEQVARTVADHNDRIYGHWNGGERVPGLIEQNTEFFKWIKQRNEERDVLTSSLLKYGKFIVPAIMLLAVIGLLNMLGIHDGAAALAKMFTPSHGG
jgi:hypothetical protein